MASKRERDYARRRHADWQARRGARAAAVRRRRRRSLVSLAAVVVLALVAAAVVVAVRSSGSSSSASPAPSSSATASGSASASSTAGRCPAPTSKAPTEAPTQLPSAPAASVAQARTWTGRITTSCGDLGISLDGAAAPKAVASFVTLARDGYFVHSRCHRLTTSGLYVLQCGDPTGTGSGGPGYSFGPPEHAPSDGDYPAGTIAMARSSDPSSQGSQFFIVYKDSTLPTTGGGYSIFGTVTSGLSVVREVAAAGSDDSNGAGDGAPNTPISIEQVSVQ